MNLAITGHRPPKLGGYRTPNRVFSDVNWALSEYFAAHPDIARVYTGMALGVDQWVAELCIARRVPFVACIPFHGFESRWPESSQRNFRLLCNQAESVIHVTSTQEYQHRLLQTRNEFMVQHCDRLLAVFNGAQTGGTWNCIRYAQMVRKPWESLLLSRETWEEAARIERDLDVRRVERTAQQMRVSAPLPPAIAVSPPQITPSQFASMFDRPVAAGTQNDPQRRRRLRVGQQLPPPMMVPAVPEAWRTPVPVPFNPNDPQLLSNVLRDTVNRLSEHPPAGEPGFLGMDYGHAERTVMSAFAVPREMLPDAPPPESVKEIIAPDKRFTPGRVLDLDD